MFMYKYAVNTRGRAVRTNDRKLPDLLARGFIEISKEQFDRQKYFPEMDRGKTASLPVNQKVAKKGTIKTVLV